jgi:L,D-transpeptidase YcbB
MGTAPAGGGTADRGFETGMSRVRTGALVAGSALLLGAAGALGWYLAPGEPSAPPVETPPPPPKAHWNGGRLHQLLAAIDAARAEGLRPKDYHRAELAAFLTRGGYTAEIAPVADKAVHGLAHDYIDGRVTHRARFDWHIEHDRRPLETIDADVANTVNAGRLTEYLQSLLPQDPRYAALRVALGRSTHDPARRAAIRASMERWRWMPRSLGLDYIWVNVPTYRLKLYRDGAVAATHVVVVGAPKTPTPMLSAAVGHVIVNPWWTLPPTVLREGKRYAPERGYVWQTIGGKTYVRQKPGPNNALGRMKIDMPNAWAIYLHDTPAKSGFAQTTRALSHGCIRVQDITRLGAELADPARVGAALETFKMKSLPVDGKLPVYIVYFTAEADADGDVVVHPDPYARDAPLNAALDGVRYRVPETTQKRLEAEQKKALTANRAVVEPSRAQPEGTRPKS